MRLEPLSEKNCRTSEKFAFNFLMNLSHRYRIFKIVNGFADFFIRKKGRLRKNTVSKAQNFKRNTIIECKEVLKGGKYSNIDMAIVELLTADKMLGGDNELWIICKKNIATKDEYSYSKLWKRILNIHDIKVTELEAKP